MILQHIHRDIAEKKPLLAVLLDPEKVKLQALDAHINAIHAASISHIFIGGSTDKKNQISPLIEQLKKRTDLPLLLFPGDANQVVAQADGILFLSLLSGRNPRFLIDHHIDAVPALLNSSLEIIPTGYILIDGGKQTAVQRISQTQPLAQSDLRRIVHTAIAGQFMGKKLIYLEAGSGAIVPVSPIIIKAVKEKLTIPLIVGGGIKNKHQLDQAYAAGADLVVIGTAFEQDPHFFNKLQH